ncbi:MAG: hypothetical protein Q8N63_01375 [Nanoarchaeota archaeon]|nr:hypothetical protein [Nanoarchaeota archaeon]
MAKKKSGISELTKVFDEILRVSRKYSYLWDDLTLIEDKSLVFAGGWIAQDETFLISVKKYDDKLLIGGKNFSYELYGLDSEGLSASQAALRINNDFSSFNIKADDLRKKFLFCIRKASWEIFSKKNFRKNNLSNTKR